MEIVDLPIDSMVIFHSYVSLPEGTPIVDGRIIQTLVIQQPPAPPITMLFLLFGSLLRMDEENQTLRSGTKIRSHNVEIWGDRG